jgi:hypothetical protein
MLKSPVDAMILWQRESDPIGQGQQDIRPHPHRLEHEHIGAAFWPEDHDRLIDPAFKTLSSAPARMVGVALKPGPLSLAKVKMIL